MNSRGTVLIADDDKDVRECMDMWLRCEGCQTELAEDGYEALDLLEARSNEIGAIVLDFLMPRCDGMSALREIRKLYGDIPVFILSAVPTPLNVVQAMKAGASDFIAKPVSKEDIARIVQAASLKTRPVIAAVTPTRTDQRTQSATHLGNCPQMRLVRSMLRQIGPCVVPVLIQGETGSGKEVIAKELHQLSPRANQPFLKLNCAALPSELVESELFGYERGAFTGAFQRKAGMFELADRGTLFLDEIGDMDVKLQAKLLQVLQDREFRRLGGKDVITVDARVIAATHCDLEAAIRDHTFREDLYYRLNVVTIHLPPLRDRGDDIIRLAMNLLERHATAEMPVQPLTPALKEALLLHSWPGNVRELENAMRRYLIMKDPEWIISELQTKRMPRSLSLVPRASAPEALVTEELEQAPEPVLGSLSPLREVVRAKEAAESSAILRALDLTHWNRKRAARMLNIDYKALLYRMKKLSIDDRPPTDLLTAAGGSASPAVRQSFGAESSI